MKEGESLDLTLEENLMLEEPFEEPERKGDKKLPPPKLEPPPKELKYRSLMILTDTHSLLALN
jgi:hypothetical protein